MFAYEMMSLCRVKEPMRHRTVLLVSIATGQVLPPTSLWLSVALGESITRHRLTFNSVI